MFVNDNMKSIHVHVRPQKSLESLSSKHVSRRRLPQGCLCQNTADALCPNLFCQGNMSCTGEILNYISIHEIYIYIYIIYRKN